MTGTSIRSCQLSDDSKYMSAWQPASILKAQLHNCPTILRAHFHNCPTIPVPATEQGLQYTPIRVHRFVYDKSNEVYSPIGSRCSLLYAPACTTRILIYLHLSFSTRLCALVFLRRHHRLPSISS
ncbi:hypothetical protein IG631_06473 [Alternaria alternata]|nr:hypothetical protein IG631_06473 [Alternaria alternata]